MGEGNRPQGNLNTAIQEIVADDFYRRRFLYAMAIHQTGNTLTDGQTALLVRGVMTYLVKHNIPLSDGETTALILSIMGDVWENTPPETRREVLKAVLLDKGAPVGDDHGDG